MSHDQPHNRRSTNRLPTSSNIKPKITGLKMKAVTSTTMHQGKEAWLIKGVLFGAALFTLGVTYLLLHSTKNAQLIEIVPRSNKIS